MRVVISYRGPRLWLDEGDYLRLFGHTFLLACLELDLKAGELALLTRGTYIEFLRIWMGKGKQRAKFKVLKK